MIAWFFYLVLDVLFNIIAYLTNPIVCLFADDLGNLPNIFLWWSTWDNHLDIEWMITEHHVPSWAEYDFNKHYRYYSEWEAEKTIGEHRGYVELLDPNFTIKERFQRYICRLAWLYRNCAYGFSYWVTGRVVDGDKLIDSFDEKRTGYRIAFRHYKYWFIHEPFVIYTMIRWNPKDISWLKWTKIDRRFFIKTFIGWKCQSTKPGEKQRVMLAAFFWPFK